MRRPTRAAGFTLIEVIVAIGILGVIVAIVGATFAGALGAQRAADRRTDMTHAARTAIDRLAQDLTSSFVQQAGRPGQTGQPGRAGQPGQAGQAGQGGLGLVVESRELEGAPRDRVAFPTYASPIGGGDQPSSDVALVEYELIVSDDRRDWRLVRRQATSLRAEALAEAPGDVVAERVVGFDVKVYDGKEWVDTWNDRTKLPRAVEVVVRVAPEPHPGAERPWGNGPLSEAWVFTYGTRLLLPLAKP